MVHCFLIDTAQHPSLGKKNHSFTVNLIEKYSGLVTVVKKAFTEFNIILRHCKKKINMDVGNLEEPQFSTTSWKLTVPKSGLRWAKCCWELVISVLPGA